MNLLKALELKEWPTSNNHVYINTAIYKAHTVHRNYKPKTYRYTNKKEKEARTIALK